MSISIRGLLARFCYGWPTRPLVWAAGNETSQRILAFVLNCCQHLMGIGTGAHVSCSGERTLVDVLRKHAKPPYVVFDVGANIGDFVEIVAKAFKPGEYTVHVFEPAEATYNHLFYRVVGSIPGVVLNKLGLSRAAGTGRLFYDDAESGLASMVKRQTLEGKPFNRHEQIRLSTLDAYCKKHAVDHIDLLKIDVEGFDLDVLQGAVGLFERGAIRIASFEFSGANVDTGTFVFDFYRFFSQNGLRLYRLTRSGYLMPIREYSESLEQFRTTIFVAIKENP